MCALRWPTPDGQRFAGWSWRLGIVLTIGFARNRHGVCIQERLVAAIRQSHPGEHFDFGFADAARCCALIIGQLRHIIGLPVKASGHIGQGQRRGHRFVALRYHRQCGLS